MFMSRLSGTWIPATAGRPATAGSHFELRPLWKAELKDNHYKNNDKNKVNSFGARWR